MKTRKASEGEMPDSPAHPHHTTELLFGLASQERSQESSWQEVTIQPAFYCHPNSFPMFSVIPFLWVHFALVTIGLGPVCKERTREMVASRSFSGKGSPGHTWHTALLGMIFRPSAECADVDLWQVLWFRVHISAKYIPHRAFPANIFEVVELPCFMKTAAPNNYA